MINVNYISSMYISNTINGRRERVLAEAQREPVPAGTGSRREPVPADLPEIQYIYTYNIHTDNNKYNNKYCRVPVGTGSRSPAPERVPADRYTYVYGVLDICQKGIAN